MDSHGNSLAECPNDRESRDYIKTGPLIPAESLCLTGLAAVQESRNKKSEIGDVFASICYDLDHAIALPHRASGDYQHHLLLQIGHMLHSAQRNREYLEPANLSASLQLKRLAIFMPAFRTRIEETQLTTGLIRQTHSGLCSYINTLDGQYMRKFQHDIHAKKLVSSHKAECEVMALLTRTGDPALFPYPALAREESSHARKQHNHDFYTLPGRKKKAVQVKTSANGSGYRDVALIKHYDVLRAFKKDPETLKVQWDPSRGHEDYEWPNQYKYEQVLTGETLSPLAELLLEEQEQENMFDRNKKNALNLATRYVTSRLK